MKNTSATTKTSPEAIDDVVSTRPVTGLLSATEICDYVIFPIAGTAVSICGHIDTWTDPVRAALIPGARKFVEIGKDEEIDEKEVWRIIVTLGKLSLKSSGNP